MIFLKFDLTFLLLYFAVQITATSSLLGAIYLKRFVVLFDNESLWTTGTTAIILKVATVDAASIYKQATTKEKWHQTRDAMGSRQ